MFQYKAFNGSPFTKFLTIGILLFTVIHMSGAQTQTWIENSFEDFIDGSFDAAGQNIYVSRDGKIRTINRFDLNEDGWIDLLFPGTHDNHSLIPATLASVSSGR